jgi:hypothetical protein
MRCSNIKIVVLLFFMNNDESFMCNLTKVGSKERNNRICRNHIVFENNFLVEYIRE